MYCWEGTGFGGSGGVVAGLLEVSRLDGATPVYLHLAVTAPNELLNQL